MVKRRVWHLYLQIFYMSRSCLLSHLWTHPIVNINCPVMMKKMFCEAIISFHAILRKSDVSTTYPCCRVVLTFCHHHIKLHAGWYGEKGSTIAPKWTLIHSISPAFSCDCVDFFCHLPYVFLRVPTNLGTRGTQFFPKILSFGCGALYKSIKNSIFLILAFSIFVLIPP